MKCTWKSPAPHLGKLQSWLWAEKEQRFQSFRLLGPSLTSLLGPSPRSNAGSSSPPTLSPSHPVPSPPWLASVAVCGVGWWPRLSEWPWFTPRHTWKSSSGVRTGGLGSLSQQSHQKKHLSTSAIVQCLSISTYTDEAACLSCCCWSFCYRACWE